MPPELPDRVSKQLAQNNVAGAIATSTAEPNFLGFVIAAGLREVDGGWPVVEKAMEDATAEQTARLYRKLEYLSVIANIAPMIGLLGTVVGMIFAFQEVASTQGAARAAQLASGIYHALVSTVGGLIVAIPSLAAFAVFRNRVDQYVAESAYAAQQVLLPVKRALSSRRPPRPTSTEN
jgi:biopolymer transport protein ExbB